MHLAIVSPYPPAITGIGQYGYYVSRMLARSGSFDRITLLTNRTPDVRAVDVPPSMSVERLWRPNRIDVGSRIALRLSQLRPDLVWFNLGSTVFGQSLLANISGMLAPAAVRRLGFPSVLTMHEVAELADLRQLRAPGGPLSSLGARWVTWAYTQADVVCVTLKRYTEWLAARRSGRRFVHIPIGMYEEPEVLDEPSSPRLLFFTTLAPFKGLDVLLEAHRMLRDRFPQLSLTIAGAEHPRFPGYLQHMQHHYRDLPGIQWLGFVPERNVRDVFRNCQVVVLPYSAATGSSSVLCQAMMWGRPVVASGLPELRSEVADVGLDAEFFTCGDSRDLAAALERFLGSPSLRLQQVRHNAKAVYRLGMDQTCRAYLHAFNLALKEHSADGRIHLPSDYTTESA